MIATTMQAQTMAEYWVVRDTLDANQKIIAAYNVQEAEFFASDKGDIVTIKFSDGQVFPHKTPLTFIKENHPLGTGTPTERIVQPTAWTAYYSNGVLNVSGEVDKRHLSLYDIMGRLIAITSARIFRFPMPAFILSRTDTTLKKYLLQQLP
ncbi:hypothetical protein FACS1894181_17620 [Bacteroidia bacterium]|nr:hypothetical protein FACS1894181_17620 [Bacteroidia bacterium]